MDEDVRPLNRILLWGLDNGDVEPEIPSAACASCAAERTYRNCR
jgi:hypothetical protein